MAETAESTFICCRCAARYQVSERALDLGPCGTPEVESGLCRKCWEDWQVERSKVPVTIIRAMGDEGPEVER